MKRQFLIDTDTASADAVALIMALRSPEVEVVGITTVAGNVEVRQASRNALYTEDLCGSSAPVFTVAEKLLRRAHQSADWFHGRDGLGDHGYPSPRREAEKKGATEALIELIEANPGVVLVTLGPLTNVALALQKNPGIAAKVSRCVVMGGAPCCEGNVTPAAKFAIECNSRAQEAYFMQTGEHGISLPDPVAMAVALEERVVTSASAHYWDVETESELTRGMTVVDRLNVSGDARNREVWKEQIGRGKKAKIIWTIENGRWKEELYKRLR